MKATAIAFLAAASLAAALVSGFVSLGGSSKSLTPIELRAFAHTMRPHSSRARHGVGAPRIEVPQRVEQTTFSSYRARTPKRAAR